MFGQWKSGPKNTPNGDCAAEGVEPSSSNRLVIFPLNYTAHHIHSTPTKGSFIWNNKYKRGGVKNK